MNSAFSSVQKLEKRKKNKSLISVMAKIARLLMQYLTRHFEIIMGTHLEKQSAFLMDPLLK
jgi:hypothetical protein